MPRCGCNVVTGKKGYFCESSICRFALWADNKFLAAKRIRLSKSQAAQLLRDGRIHIDEVYSAKRDTYYPQTLSSRTTARGWSTGWILASSR